MLSLFVDIIHAIKKTSIEVFFNAKAYRFLESRVVWRSREWDNVTNVLHTRSISY